MHCICTTVYYFVLGNIIQAPEPGLLEPDETVEIRCFTEEEYEQQIG